VVDVPKMQKLLTKAVGSKRIYSIYLFHVSLHLATEEMETIKTEIGSEIHAQLKELATEFSNAI
jgi:hypothetical protein